MVTQDSPKGVSNMNTKIFYLPVLVCGAVLALAPAGYAKTYPMTASDIATGATAQLQVAKEKDGNSQLEVKANGLAKPGRLTPAAKTYVVWVQQEGSQPKSQGELKVGNNHKGDLKTATTLHTFNVFVTAETDAQTKFPSEQVVLRATVQE
jgi:hypothetical protein